MGEETSIPKVGLKLKLNHVYPETRNQHFTPSFRVIWTLIPLILRYIWYYIKAKITGKFVVMDYISPAEAKQIYGVPIGGLGCGTIGRGFRGEFCRFQMKPGLYEWNTVDANQFIVTVKDEHQKTIFHSLLSTFPKKTLRSWESLIDRSQCFYTGLYPRSWTEYDLSKYGVKLVCRQVSPVIPNDYENSSLPCAVFVWNIQNLSPEERTVTIAFTFKNGTGTKKQDKASTSSSESFSSSYTEGVLLHHTINKMPCTYTLAAKSLPGVSISKCLYFDPNSDGIKPWMELKTWGQFEKQSNDNYGEILGEMASGVACKTTVPSAGAKEVELCLVWDMPVVQFPGKAKKFFRFYTEIFHGENAPHSIASSAFSQYRSWESDIYKWQSPVLLNDKLPDWYKGALFNESYFLSDGGSLWTSVDKEELETFSENDPRRTVGRFIYLEGHEYKMYNSYDVHFYASHGLHKNWPLLQRALQYDLKDTVFMEIPDKVETLYDGKVVERKVPNTVPHDIGAPGEEPFLLINSYPIHDVSTWRDLNPKFVLQVFRDAVATKPDIDKNYIKDMYNACYIVMEKTLEYDIDDDGLIENSGYPDQTFDSWIMVGSSAYCGGLWLAALYAMKIMSEALDKQEDTNKFQELLGKAREAYENKLWNGLYYNFDCSKTQMKSIMADQLCGHWYLRCCGVNNYLVFPKDNVRKALQTIYESNVQGFCNGNMGAVNGMINGDVDYFTVQSEEVWTGVTYALAANMIFEGMVEEGFKTAEGMYRSMSEKFGLAFNTPEALYAHKYYRAIGYMRPLSIWSMQLALEEIETMNKQLFV